MNFHQPGRSPCPRHEVPSGGRDGEGGGDPPSPLGNKIEIRKCLDDF